VSARDAVESAIRDHGPIAWSEYMELALYGAGGFYERPPIGTDPDTAFATSPHVHPVFAQLLSAALLELWDGLGHPEPFRLVEAGAGDGTLARQLLDAFADIEVEYTATERSSGARAALALIDGINIAGSLPPDPHVVFANELLDNLPFDRARGGSEVRVGLDDGELVEVSETDHGEETIDPVGAFAWIDELAGSLTNGYALLIDYGGLGGPGGPSHGYRAHRVVEDLLDDPGGTDITAGVDFEAIGRHAERLGLVAFETCTQHDALIALGFESWVHDELSRQRDQLDRREGIEAVRTWSGRSRSTLLADPAALGRLRWLVVATPGLPEPAWLVSARKPNG